MKANPDKCHLLISSTSQSELKIGNVTVKISICEKVLGIKIDNKLRLNAHVEGLCKKVSSKMHTLDRVTPYMTGLILMNAFFRSHPSYCPVVWMCHSRTVNNKINFTKGALKSFITISFQAFKVWLIRTDLFQCTLVISKHLL